jgi:hypothetical protein
MPLASHAHRISRLPGSALILVNAKKGNTEPHRAALQKGLAVFVAPPTPKDNPEQRPRLHARGTFAGHQG